MKTKKWYSALLAFALLATGCSNEIDPDNNGGGSGSGEETAYVTINVMASSNAQSTKAPAGGEDGDGNDSGTEAEQVINDLNIYYVDITTILSDIGSGDHLSFFNFALGDDRAVQTEYITDSDFDNVHGGGVTGHLAKATVKFKVPEAGTHSYLILALANMGEKKEYAKVRDIKDAMLDGLYSNESNPTKFLMTTHQFKQGDLSSIVTFTKENKNPNTPASATIFLERLAARVDLQLSTDLSSADGDYLFKADGTKLTAGDKVKMNGYLVVNQLQPSTRFLKLLSGEVSSSEDAIPSSSSTYFLYPEDYGPSVYRYVLDPWTTGKTDPSSLPTDPSGLTYKNHFVQDINSESFATIGDDAYTTATRIAYVRENTMDLDKQLNGFSTGIIFKGQYKPEKVRKYDESDALVKEVALTGSTFFRTQSNVLCEDMRTIAVLAFSSSHVTPSTEMIKAVFNDGGDFGSITVDNVKAVAAGMTGGAFGAAFKNYLNSCTVVTDMTWAKYLASASLINTFAELTTVTTENKEKLISDYKISCFYLGNCYYKYWIRHADNGDPHKMGLMEFAIVRNNLYQVEVKGVNKLGDPLPFVPGQDDPSNTDENDEESYITVNVYVKNWVKRNNSDIIL